MGTSRLRWVLALTSLAYFIVVLDSLVVVTALPRMQQDLHVGLDTLQWTVNAYGIAFAAGIITAAALGDRCGRRRVFITGLALFTLASAACAVAPGATALIAARAVQGLGGAAVLPLSLTILTTAFPARRRGAIVGIYGGLAGLAVALGPLVGGAVTEGLDWHWIFWINVPLGVAGSLLSLRLLPESYGTRARLDLPGGRAGHGRCGRAGLGAGPDRAGRLGQRRGDRRTGRGRGAAGRVLRVGGPGGRADAAAPAAPHPGVRGRERDRVPDDRLDVFRRVPDHAVLPVRAGLLAAGRRAAAAALVRHPDADLAGGGRAVRPDRPAAGDRDRAAAAGGRVQLGGGHRDGHRQHGRRGARAAGGRGRHLDGAAHRADRRAQLGAARPRWARRPGSAP